jgi:branched-chain amino acid transport system permease protein
MVPQILVNGLVAGLLYALVALGFSLIYAATKIFHIAHGAVYTTAAYFFLAASFVINSGGSSLESFLALAIAFGSVALLAVASELFVYRPLLSREASPLVTFIASLGLYIVLVNLIAIIYGNETRVLTSVNHASTTIGPIVVTDVQIIQALVSSTVLLLVLVVIEKTSLGRNIRALSDNPTLISVMGFDAKRIRLVVFVFGSLLAAISCLLRGFDVGIQPNAGLQVTLTATVAVIIGGVGSHMGAVLSALALGLLQNIVSGILSAEWKDAVTLVLLIVVLIYRSSGLLASQMRLEEQ